MGYILKVRDDKGNVIGIPAIQGEKGDAFTYEDFTEEQLEGLRGDNGKSAYEIACDNGFEGTEEDFLQAIGFYSWNVTKNVGSIVANPITKNDLPSMDDSANWKVLYAEYNSIPKRTKAVTSYSFGFISINSGTVYLNLNMDENLRISSNYECERHESGVWMKPKKIIENISLKIYVDNYLTKEYSQEIGDPYIDSYSVKSVRDIVKGFFTSIKENPTLLSVSKESTIKIELVVSTGTLSDLVAESADVFFYEGKGFDEVYLSANVNTPYKYNSLADHLVNDTEATTEEILDTLLGV